MGSFNDNIGDQIKNAVQAAIDKQDFSSLVNTVGNSLNDAGNRMRDGLQWAADTQRAAQQRISETQREQELARQRREEAARVNARFGPSGSKRIKGILACIGGTILFLSGLSGAGTVLTPQGAATGSSSIVSGIITLILLLGGGGFLAVWGFNRARIAKRFEAYKNIIGARETCEVAQLSAMTGRSEGKVIKDLEKMVKAGLFTQAHLSSDKKVLYVSNEAFSRYLENQLQEAQKQPQKTLDESIAAAKAGDIYYTPEQAEMIKRGDAYVAQLRALNDDIPGEVVSEKIYRIENVTAKIFERAKENPEVTEDLDKLMDYYLPITVRLLEAYRDLDAQPIEGSNIRESKQEIEKTLDVLNDGLENLLDSIFRDTAWDVSTDASVLQMMLAQEGLVGDSFADMRKKKAVQEQS